MKIAEHGFAIAVSENTFISKGGGGHDAPITDSLMAARFFKTAEGAERTLASLRHKVFRAKIAHAHVISIVLTLEQS